MRNSLSKGLVILKVEFEGSLFVTSLEAAGRAVLNSVDHTIRFKLFAISYANI